MSSYGHTSLLKKIIEFNNFIKNFYFLFRPSSQIESLSVNLVKHCTSIGKDETVDLTLMTSIETLFRSLACLNGSFLKLNDAHMCCTTKNHGLNMADAEIAFGYIRKMENLSLKNIVRLKFVRPQLFWIYKIFLN